MSISAEKSVNPSDSDHALAGRYELIKCLARHGTCSVYQANDQMKNRPVAVKVLTEQIMSDEELRRFHRGALAACAVKHPNCVQVYDFGTTPDERPYMVMEYVRGTTLRKVVQESGPMPAAKAVDIAIQLCDGLAAIHQTGVVHRDLKTANVMIENFDSKNVNVKILDFGLAKPACTVESAKPITKAGQIVGSPVYMSPEQVRGWILDARSDIYSIGCILFELLTGQPLFLGKTALETMSMHVLQPAPSLSEMMPGKNFAGVLEDVVAQAVSKESDDRYQSAEEMKAALARVAEVLKARDSQEVTAETRTRGRVPAWLLAVLFVISLLFLSGGLYILSQLMMKTH